MTTVSTDDRRDATAVASGAAAPAESSQQIARLAMGGGLNLVGQLVNQASLFGVTFLIARALGASDVGVYGQAFAIRALLQLVCLVGMRGALTRYVAVYRVDDDPGAVRGTVAGGIGVALALSSAVDGLLFSAAGQLATGLFDEPELAEPLRWVALSLPPAVVTVAALSASQGFRTMRPHALVGLMFEPLVRVVLTIALLAAGFEVRGAMIALFVASVVTAFVAVGWLYFLMRALPRVPMRFPVGEVTSYASVSWLSSLATQGLLWADIVILGTLVDSAQVGVYQVATRLLLVTSLAVQALNASFAPRAADLWRRHDLALLGRSYGATTNWILLLSVPVLALLVGFPGELLRLFGGGFVAGVSVVLLLAAGQLADVATSASGIVLNMSGHNTLNMINNLVALGSNIGLNIVLIPELGIDGAALAWAVALAVSGVLRIYQVRSAVLGAAPYDRTTVHIVGAGVLMLASVLVVGAVLDGFASLVLGGALGLLTYVGALRTLGLSENEAAVFAVVRDRFVPGRAA